MADTATHQESSVITSATATESTHVGPSQEEYTQFMNLSRFNQLRSIANSHKDGDQECG